MPWREGGPVSERKAFLMRLEAGEKMMDLCREYGISRKTAYKFYERYKAEGDKGLIDRSRAPLRVARKCSEAVSEQVLALRRQHPTWGPKKLRASLMRSVPGVDFPAPSTIGDLLKRHGLAAPRKKRAGVSAYDAPLRAATSPNDVWCADFKGQFRLGSGRYCYPLTISDRCSRMLLGCEALEGTDEEGAFEVFTLVFTEYGLPACIRSDNGVPFASQGLWGLSRLSVWWLRQGIWPERIALGCPQQNGQHERMHRVLKAETTRPAGQNQLQQQERFDEFRREYNEDRPHEALGQRTPLSRYTPSPRIMLRTLPELTYPLHDDAVRVDRSGKVRVGRVQVFLTSCLAGEYLGIRELENGNWLLSFAKLDLGHIDPRTRRFEAGLSPFGVQAPNP